MRKRGCHGTSREIHKLGHILDIYMCAASVPYSKINLKEKDVPGAILPHIKVESNSSEQLRRWLSCRKQPTIGRKHDLIAR